MRSFVFLAVVVLASGTSLPGWEEWGEDLGITGPKTPDRTRSNVCLSTSRDGSTVKICCEGYTGSIEEGCPTPVCDPACLNGGLCKAPNECKCLDAFFGSTCEEVKKEYEWSDWVNLDTESTIGNFEELYRIRDELGVCKNSVPQAIECRTVGDIDHAARGQVVMCDRRVGLWCRNDEQPNDETCDDYKVRILCPVKDDVSKKNLHTCIHKTKEYDPGEKVDEADCVTCTCMTDGRWECLEKDCERPEGVEIQTCILGETVFNLGETTTLDCKTCTCEGMTGWRCTPNSDTTCVAPAVDDHCWIENHSIFFHGQTAKNDCNTCICKNREWDCTQMICPNKTVSTPHFFQCVNPDTGEQHNDGDIIKRDCNICVCTQGKWDCTKDPCEEGTELDSDVSLSLRKVCTTPNGVPYPHGATVSMDCNACKCFDSKWLCTRRYCSPEVYNNSLCVDEVTTSLVKSGQTIRRGCDVCMCNSGNLTCTMKPCVIKTGICFDEQRRFLTTSTTFERQYHPECTETGLFRPIQCNPLHGVCFCVTSLGHVVPGTTVKQDSGTPNCSPYTLTPYDPMHFTMPVDTQTSTYPCIETRTDTTTRLTGYDIPKCLPDGRFAPLQCDPHTGVCYCVTEQGTTIPGTLLHVSKGRPNCDVLRERQVTPCLKEVERSELYKLPFKPECDENGQYRPLQVNTLTNVRFCVDVNGVIFEETITKDTSLNCDSHIDEVQEEVQPYTNRVDSERAPLIIQTYPVKDVIHNTPRCKLQRKISEHVPTVYRPKCENDGRYRPMQCPEGMDVCFCVDVTGAVVSETKRLDGLPGPDCSAYRSIFALVTPTNTSTVVVHPDVSLIHSGWDPELSEVDHLHHRVGPQYETTEEPRVLKTNVTACIRQQQIAAVVPGVFYPSCQHNGSFSTLQQQPLSKKVYCVDKNGLKIEGTEVVVDYGPLPDCTPYWNTTVDMKEITKHWSRGSYDIMRTEPIPLDNLFPAGLHHHPNCTKQQEITSRIEGAVVPSCEPNGTYTSLQCNATTGVCYCMLPYGDVLPETVLPMSKGTPPCWHLRNVSIQQTTNPAPEVCRLPVIKGPCRGRLIRWTFSQLLNKCVKFVYGGCLGNENRFETEEECQNTCGFLTPQPDLRPMSCERKLFLYNRMNIVQRGTMRRPWCTPEGLYQRKQCEYRHTEEGRVEKVCDCVNPLTGEMVSCMEGEVTLTLEETVTVTTTVATPEFEGCMSDGIEYHPHDTFFIDCNSCTCIGNNEAACTLKSCPVGVCYHDGTIKEEYDRGCDKCTCIGGHWSCSARPNCSPEYTPIQEPGSATECHTEDGTILRVGAIYYDKCNKCVCESNGEMACESKFCLPRHCYYEGNDYHNWDTVMQDCNECTCFSGHWDCSSYTCDPYDRTLVRLDGCEYMGINREDGETWWEKCNECECFGSNITVCHKKICNPTSCYLKGEEIRAGQSKEVDCNTCICFNGHLSCTEKECLNAEIDIVTEPVDPTITCTFEGKTYTNGQEFWKDCNPCRCYDDGQVQCETTYCSPNLCYKEGLSYRNGEVLLTDIHKCTCFRGGEWHCTDKPADSGPPDMIECPPERPTKDCLTNPCDSTICPTQPDAICVPDYCGQCLPAFFDVFGNRLRC